MKKMISYLLITAMTITMMTMALVNVSAATDTTKIKFQFPENEGKAYVTLDNEREVGTNHNYGNVPDTWTYTADDADYLTVAFDELTYVEEDVDRVLVFDKDDCVYGIYTGNQLTGKTICVPGNKVTIRVYTNKIITEDAGTDIYHVNITEVKPLRLGVMDVEDETIVNVTTMQRYLTGEEELTAEQIELGDTNGDGKITVEDITALQRYFAEMIG